ncbi:hypothetical protein AGMMS50249_0650 [candidate division SR1 bacterium]|nr:hypothetical protein AGMMS50249_0650 [candidate division SR1 bacterium]
MQKRLFAVFALMGMLILTGCGPAVENTTNPTTQSTPAITIANGDTIQISYLFSLPGNVEYDRGETAIVAGDNQQLFGYISFLNAKVGDTLRGELTPEDTNLGDQYDVREKQSLAKIYFDELGVVPTIGANVYFNGIGTGEIISSEMIDDSSYYLIDFNSPETYKNLTYEITILDIQK